MLISVLVIWTYLLSRCIYEYSSIYLSNSGKNINFNASKNQCFQKQSLKVISHHLSKIIFCSRLATQDNVACRTTFFIYNSVFTITLWPPFENWDAPCKIPSNFSPISNIPKNCNNYAKKGLILNFARFLNGLTAENMFVNKARIFKLSSNFKPPFL